MTHDDNHDNYEETLTRSGPTTRGFGTITSAVKENRSVLGPEDLSRHIYLLAGSGSGKTTLIRTLYEHLEMANAGGTFASSPIYIDIKDEDAKLFLRQCEEKTIRDGNIIYLDINHTDFAINLLELPPYPSGERDAIVSRMVGHIIEMFKEFYLQQQTFVQMERILKLLLFYLYSNTDNPTMLDLYEIIVRLQSDGKAELERIFQIYKNFTGPEMEVALHSVARLSKDSWIPLLNRIEMFATDNYLKRKFSVSRTTIDFDKMLAAGNTTVFRISDTETPRYAHGLAIMAIVIKIWFAVQERASRIESGKRSLVVLTLDEFQRIKDLTVLTSILSQARAYNLGLILSHQNTAQIQAELLETITGNTATQIYGRVSGIDASRVSRIIDPHFARELTEQIASQPDFVFTAKVRAPTGEEQTAPMRFRASAPPKLLLSDQQAREFIQTMKDKYGMRHREGGFEASLITKKERQTKWLTQLGAQYLEQSEWLILNALYGSLPQQQSLTLADIVRACRFTEHRDTIALIIKKMQKDNLLEISRRYTKGTVTVTRYKITAQAVKSYFELDYFKIGTADDIKHIAQQALAYYRGRGCFVTLARQDVKKGKLRTDLVAYDYDAEKPISVEIESRNEVVSHAEHVLLNMTKWEDLGFLECHVWSTNSNIDEIREVIENRQTKENVKTFVI